MDTNRMIALLYVTIQAIIALFISIIGVIHVRRCMKEDKETTMATLSAEAKQLLQRVKGDGIEYIVTGFCDSYCRFIGKLIPASDLETYMKNGFMFPPASYTFIARQVDASFGGSSLPTSNTKFVLDIDTYKTLPPSLCLKTYNKETTKMAQIRYHPLNPKYASLDPRVICKNIISKLATEFGVHLYSAFEHEFQLFKPSNGELVPCWDDPAFCNNLELLSNGYGSFLVECERTLRALDVRLGTMHLEAAPGQCEWTMKPAIGIQAADNSFLYKQSIKQIARNHGLRAMFATTPQCDKTEFNSNGAHFNHSLWDKDGKNVFFDANASDKLSLLGRYWVGGILKHVKGMTVFAVPTVNCYRRVNNKHNWSPCTGSWAFGNRSCMIRVKINGDDPNGCYLEYRLPCSASNPYYVISSVLLAGMDGIRNKILPRYAPVGDDDEDPNLDERFDTIPQCLADALNELQKDNVMCEGFGEYFVDRYCKVKQLEIAALDKYATKFGDRNKAEKWLFSKM
eukprot:54371_1